jgi:hypothetical protein
MKILGSGPAKKDVAGGCGKNYVTLIICNSFKKIFRLIERRIMILATYVVCMG